MKGVVSVSYAGRTATLASYEATLLDAGLGPEPVPALSLDDGSGALASLPPPESPLQESSVHVSDSLLGKGAFSQVFRGDVAGRPVAVKVLDSADLQKEMDEVRRLSRVAHPFCLRYFGVCELRAGKSGIVTELCDQSLRQYMHDATTLCSSRERVRLALLITNAVWYLHSVKIVHGDLKGDNVLVVRAGSSVTVRVSDFGVSKLLTTLATKTVGHDMFFIPYAAPEVLESGLFSAKSDMWALALLLHDELFCGNESLLEEYRGRFEQVAELTRSGEKLAPPKDLICAAVWPIMDACWRQERAQRPRAAEVSAQLRALLTENAVSADDAPLYARETCEVLDGGYARPAVALEYSGMLM